MSLRGRGIAQGTGVLGEVDNVPEATRCKDDAYGRASAKDQCDACDAAVKWTGGIAVDSQVC